MKETLEATLEVKIAFSAWRQENPDASSYDIADWFITQLWRPPTFGDQNRAFNAHVLLMLGADADPAGLKEQIDLMADMRTA